MPLNSLASVMSDPAWCNSKNLNHGGHKVSQRENTEEPLVRNHPLNFRRIRFADQDVAAQLALALLVFRSQDVAQECMRPLDLPARGFLEALGGAFMCF